MVEVAVNVLIIIFFHQVEQKIGRVNAFAFRHKPGVDPVLYQFFD